MRKGTVREEILKLKENVAKHVGNRGSTPEIAHISSSITDIVYILERLEVKISVVEGNK